MFATVTSKRDIAIVVQLARDIWREHYTPLIGTAQVEYMLEKFQSPAAVAEQIATQHFHYFLIRDNQKPVGYIGLQTRGAELFLSKIYLTKSARGGGLGKRAVDFIRHFATVQQATTITLTVNRHNTAAITTYQKLGFIQTGEVVTDIGGGYVMDDFAFELKLGDGDRGG